MSPSQYSPDPAPLWLAERLNLAGGWVPFSTYMDWALHDPQYGAYGSGRLQVGPRGDFATSPSLGSDFAELLLPQVLQWLDQHPQDQPLALVETGPGEGQLALQLSTGIARSRPDLCSRLELVLVEPNPGMAERQQVLLEASPLRCRWSSFEQLATDPVCGVILAHEVLDALPVARISWDGSTWSLEGVALRTDGGLELEARQPLPAALGMLLEHLDLQQRAAQWPPGSSTELHPGLEPWLLQAARSLHSGHLLVVDYAHEAWRYYAPQRSQGTLMAYREQQASGNPLQDPGHWDLTAHLCLESLEAAATAAGWQHLGQRRQGEALLALGLAQRLHALQAESTTELSELLARREALLRLVDPHTLGDFRWIGFRRPVVAGPLPPPLFLEDPPLL